jgi:uncharacterized protein YecE (DUF72 family)
MQRGSIRIGPAGFSYADWRGIVYPSAPRGDFDPLAWLARFFDLLEINVSFYRTPSAQRARDWLERAPQMHFSAKLPQELSHARHVDARQLSAHLRFLAPLRAADRFVCSLLQFPWSFRPRSETLEHLRRVRAALPVDLPVAVELRHEDWLGQLEPVVGMGFRLVSIDQPAHRAAMMPLPAWREHIDYVRLHGRNAANWFGEAGRDARYDYRYSTQELSEWADRVRRLAAAAPQISVVTNNHFRGSAVADALELRALLRLPVPEYPAGLGEGFAERLLAHGQRTQPVLPDRPSAAQGELFAG